MATAIRLNQDWITSSNRRVYVVKLDDDICGYCRNQESAEEMVRSLGKNIEVEFRREKGKNYKVTSEIIQGENGLPSKYLIYSQSLGYVYNGVPKLQHTVTYISTYKCSYLPHPQPLVGNPGEGEVTIQLEPHVYESVETVEEVDEVTEDEIVDETEVEETDIEELREEPETEDDTETDTEEENEELSSEDGDISDLERRARGLLCKFFSFLE